MRFEPTDLDGVILIEPRVHHDARGWFLEVYHAERYRQAGIAETFVQDNHSRSSYGTLRGLHAQLEHPQGKLVRATRGAVWDVAVDIRPDSASFGRWTAAELSEENRRLLWIPAGFAHGFCVLTRTADVEYKCTEVYRAEDEIGIVWNDPDLAVDWPVKEPILSERDRALPRLRDLRERLRAARSS